MAITARKRVFVIKGKEYPDPAPGSPLTMAIKRLQLDHPELTNTEYGSSAEADRDVFTFGDSKIGTLG